MRLDATLAIRRDMMAQAEANLQTICASSGRLHEEVKAKEERAAKEREVVGGLEAAVKKEEREKEAMEAEWKEVEEKSCTVRRILTGVFAFWQRLAIFPFSRQFPA